MITKWDDFPIHQTSEPVAYCGTDRNFYDRYFFNGYTHNGDLFFAFAMGFYPHLNVKDGAFCVTIDGVQHNLRASCELHMERFDLSVGPIALDIIEPLTVLRIKVDDADSGIYADITFNNRSPVVKEPRFIQRIGPRSNQDYTRMTQNGCYEGFIEIAGKRIELSFDDCIGTRDRSWGVRPIGLADPQPKIPTPELQFYWLWAPLNFDDFSILFARQEERDGESWHHNMRVIPCDENQAVEILPKAGIKELHYQSGTRHLDNVDLIAESASGEAIHISLRPKFNFYMSGLGYLHPTWNHGIYHGGDVVHYDQIVLAEADPQDLLHRHVEAFVEVTLTRGEDVYQGVGVFEQMVLGVHEPSGFIDDLAFGVPASPEK